MILKANDIDLQEIAQNGDKFIAASVSSRFVSCDPEGFYDALKFMVNAGTMVVWAYRIHDELAGAVCLLKSPNIYNPKETLGDIYFIDVFPKFRKMGLAKEMIQHVEQYAKDNNIKSLSMSLKSRDIAEHIISGMGYSMLEYKIMKRIM
jgi:ribosomal protein S18 acetylase RimI-like enzyme